MRPALLTYPELLVFNWFNRKSTAPPTEPTPEPGPAPEAESQPAAPTADDYLAWAKAAYNNIQQQAAATVTEPGSQSAAAESEAPAAAEAAEPDAEPTAETTSETKPETEPETEPAAATSGPAWLQKSAALERLKETAVDAAEPEPARRSRSVLEEISPAANLELDEDFVWSARVLAAQGRQADDVAPGEIAWLTRLRQGLGKTRRSLIVQLKAIVGQGPLNEDAVLELEALLLQADAGVEATDYIIETLQQRLRKEALPPEQAIAYLKEILCALLDAPLKGQSGIPLAPAPDVLNIWLLTGVNGAGKTTTIGKLARMARQSGYRCTIAAADTFRAAAVEQVKVWGDRAGVPVIANPGKNTDPAAVVFDAINAAQARADNLLLVDTAGRLQNKKNLMDELAKIRRIIDRKAPEACVQSLLVLDATLGQNGLRQAEVFAEAAKLNGVVLAKLDGTAKGGVALAIAQQLNLPIRFIGVGEGIEDLRPFSSYEFVEALLSE